MGRIIGADTHLKRLRALNSGPAIKRIGAAIFVGAQAIQIHAQQSITAGSVSGKGHVPSKPGQPPKMDTGHLHTNIETRKTGVLTAEVQSKAQYAMALEFGTSKMVERPYMRPATEAQRHRVMELVHAVVEDILTRHY